MGLRNWEGQSLSLPLEISALAESNCVRHFDLRAHKGVLPMCSLTLPRHNQSMLEARPLVSKCQPAS